jgi:hypothetical protein
MKLRTLILVTLATLVLTGTVLARAGWFQAHAGIVRGPGRARTSLSSAAVWRWQHSEPNHWRACVLQPQ